MTTDEELALRKLFDIMQQYVASTGAGTSAMEELKKVMVSDEIKGNSPSSIIADEIADPSTAVSDDPEFGLW